MSGHGKNTRWNMGTSRLATMTMAAACHRRSRHATVRYSVGDGVSVANQNASAFDDPDRVAELLKAADRIGERWPRRASDPTQLFGHAEHQAAGPFLKRPSLRTATAIPPAGACLVHPHATNPSGSGRHPKVRMRVESSGEAAGTMVPPGGAPCHAPLTEGGHTIGERGLLRRCDTGPAAGRPSGRRLV